MKEFEWFEWFEWFGPSPIEPFNPGAYAPRLSAAAPRVRSEAGSAACFGGPVGVSRYPDAPNTSRTKAHMAANARR